MTHQRQLENRKYRNWVKAGLGLKYVQCGLAPFTDDIVRKQHVDILSKVKQKHNLSSVDCGHCTLNSLQPNHVRDKSRRCPFSQRNCNCQYPNGKTTCPNHVCSAIYDEIISLHGSTPPSPYWKNTSAEQWCNDPWSIAKCFINSSGYSEKSSPNEFDCSALLHIIVNNKGFYSHIQCEITGEDIFSKLRDVRNSIIHSTSMELEDDEVNNYIENMIAVLQDDKELLSRVEAQEAVKNLIELQDDTFIITTKSEADVVAIALEAILQKERELKQSIDGAKGEIILNKKENTDELERQVKEAKDKLETKWNEIESKLKQREIQIKSDLERKFKDSSDEIESVCIEAKNAVQKEKNSAVNDIEFDRLRATDDIKHAKKDVLDEIEQKSIKFYSDVDQKVKQTGDNAMANLVQKSTEFTMRLEKTTKDLNAKLELKGNEATRNLIQEKGRAKEEIQNDKNKAKNEVAYEKTYATNAIDQKRSTAIKDLENKKQESLTNISAHADSLNAESKVQLETTKERLERELQTHTTDLKGKLQLATDGDVEITQKVSYLEFEINKHGEQIGHLGEDVLKIEADVQQIRRRHTQHQEQTDFIQTKEDFRRRLISLYREYAAPVSVVPLQPESIHSSIGHAYVKPWITVTQLRDEQETREREVSALRDIFENDGKGLRLIYILGEAGSGKTAFCKHLIQLWCSAHSTQTQDKATRDDVDYLKKMFDFLFYVSLRHNTEFDDIQSMLISQYEDPVLEAILKNESDKCLVVLDGLDEWKLRSQQKTVSQFQTKGIPIRGLDKRYTIVTTSRPPRLESLRLKDNEIHQKLRLHGITNRGIFSVAYNIISSLNERYNKERKPNDFMHDLNTCPLSEEMQHLPVVLQQLVCIWFESGYLGRSRCDVYMRMLDLFFEWTGQKSYDVTVKAVDRCELNFLQGIKLSKLFSKIQSFEQNKYVIYFVALLAYETLLSKNKEECLSFDIRTIQNLNVPEEVVNTFVKVGLLTEERSFRFGLDKGQHLSYSFVHKTMQEFFAAVYIAMKFQMSLPGKQASRDGKNGVLVEGRRCINDHFKHKTTVDEMLELSNMIIMLCGFEPLLATHVSKHIYKIATFEMSVTEYRQSFNALPTTYSRVRNQTPVIIKDLQQLIFDIMKEIKQHEKQHEIQSSNYNLYLGDIVCEHLDAQDIKLLECIIKESVITLDVNADWDAGTQREYDELAISRVTEGRIDEEILVALAVLRSLNSKWTEISSVIASLLEENCSTLMCIRIELSNISYNLSQLFNTLSKRLPDM